MARSKVGVWHQKYPQKFKGLREDIARAFPDLWVHIVDKRVRIQGSLPVLANGVLIYRYQILVELPKDYPQSVPTVYELSCRIPRVPDGHVSDNGALCLFLPDERWKYYPPGMSIVEFLRGPVNHFFLWQEELKILGEPLIKARPHGAKGIMEYYREELKTDKLEIIIKFLEYLEGNAKGHRECFCGSGKKMRNCHFEKLLDMRKKISPDVAKQSRQRLLDYIHEKSRTTDAPG